jgi:WD40 repeat protein
VWDYDESQPLGTGVGHSAGIRQVCISPDQETIVSVGAEGAVFVWSMPSLEPAT